MVGRLPSASYWILCALAEGEAHGYLIAQRVRILAEDEVAVGTGTLYAAIERLRGDGLIALAREETVGGRIRRSYVLTDVGRHEAETETERRQRAVGRARLRLGLGLM